MEQYQELAQILHKMLEEHFERSQKRLDQRNDEDYDEQLEEKLMQEDESDVYILSKISDILHSLFGTHQSELFPFFETLLPHYTKLLVRSSSKDQFDVVVMTTVLDRHLSVHGAIDNGRFVYLMTSLNTREQLPSNTASFSSGDFR